MIALSNDQQREITTLAARYSTPRYVEVELAEGSFEPLSSRARVSEVCMVIRRQNQQILVFRKDFYPSGVLRLLTGGIEAGEQIETALLREVAEETGLDVHIERFLAVVAYRMPSTALGHNDFLTFAFLLQERGGTLMAHDPHERVECFADVAPAALYELAAVLDRQDDTIDDAIDGSWQLWGALSRRDPSYCRRSTYRKPLTARLHAVTIPMKLRNDAAWSSGSSSGS
ncbi:NUDIX hydrolase [Candidatus Gracilibacteria bacterium]|nr:NUDIX hydrolase [Candidatus Gracilibacteria bacterium]